MFAADSAAAGVLRSAAAAWKLRRASVTLLAAFASWPRFIN